MTEGGGVELTGVISNPQSPQWEGEWRFGSKSAKLPFFYRLDKAADYKEEEGKSGDSDGDRNRNRKKCGAGSSVSKEKGETIGEGGTPPLVQSENDVKITKLDPSILPGTWSGYFAVRSKEGEHHIEEKYELTVKGIEPPIMYINAEGENMYGKFTQSGEFNQETCQCVLNREYLAPTIDPGPLPEPILSVPKQPDKKIHTPGSHQTNSGLRIAERKSKRQRSMSSYLADPLYVSDNQYRLDRSLSDNSRPSSGDFHHHHHACQPRHRSSSSGRSGSWGAASAREGRPLICGANGVEREWNNGNPITPVVERLSTEELVQLLALDEGGPGQGEIRQALDEVVHPTEPAVRLAQHGNAKNLIDGAEGVGQQQKKRRWTWRPPSVDEDTGEVYEGEWQGTMRSGWGICAYTCGNMYEGGWKDGRENGSGVLMTGLRRVIYDGEWSDGKLYGRGTYYFKDGSTYTGDWRDNMRHGKGTYTLATGAEYEGEWRDNARCGRGKFSWPDGSSYDGDWLDDMMHGRGKLCLPKELTYDGYWAYGEMEGRGVCTFASGQRYEGMFRRGVKEGRGTLIFENGASYEGRFRDDAVDGQGGVLHIPSPVKDATGEYWYIPVDISDMPRIHLKAGFGPSNKH